VSKAKAIPTCNFSCCQQLFYGKLRRFALVNDFKLKPFGLWSQGFWLEESFHTMETIITIIIIFAAKYRFFQRDMDLIGSLPRLLAANYLLF
jgi:hypothetical protein